MRCSWPLSFLTRRERCRHSGSPGIGCTSPRVRGLERWGNVVEHLAAARALAPQWSRVQPLGHTVVGQLVEHRGRRSERIAELAAHYGAR